MKQWQSLIWSGVLGLTSCNTVRVPNPPYHSYQVKYRDANDDDHVDTVNFKWSGADGDFRMEDTDFDGRYDRATIYGVGIFEREVDYPVYLDAEKKCLNRAFLDPSTRDQ